MKTPKPFVAQNEEALPKAPRGVYASDGYWKRFFEGAEIYRGWRIIFHDDRWWRWNAWELGQSNTRENIMRSIDILNGEK